MIKNYFKIAWRNLRKNRLYTAINIFGLSLGLASCLLIGLYINNELSYDTFNDNAEDIVRATMAYKMSETVNYAATSGTKVGPEFKRTFPEVKDYVRTYLSDGSIKYDGKVFTESRILYADPPFFDMFSFKLLKGDKSGLLDAPNKIVITESMAKKYFGDSNPIHKTLSLKGNSMQVSGVCKDAPKNSQIKFDFVTLFTNYSQYTKDEQWYTANWITYLWLEDGVDSKKLQVKVNEYMDSDAIREQTGAEGEAFLHYRLEPLLDVHLKSELPGFEPNGKMIYIYVFIVIALLILLIASANYTNLATAQSSVRSGEIGIRKVMGASKKQVFFQFISESTLITFIAGLIALLIALLVIPKFNLITGREFQKVELLQPLPLLLLFLICAIVSVLSGLYPAVIMSGARVMGIIKNGFGSTAGHRMMRKGLIVAQFAISVFLITYTIVILKQMDYIQHKELGYDKDHIMVLPITAEVGKQFTSMKQALTEIYGVKSVTAAYETPEFVKWGDGISVTDNGTKKEISLNAMPIDLNYLETLDMKLAAGRDFLSSDFAMMDTVNQRENFRQPYIINRKLAEMIGWEPDDAIGKMIENRALGPIVGVVENFNFSSLHEPIGPLLMFLERDYSRIFMLRIDQNAIQNTISNVESLWNERTNGLPFQYHFLDEDYNALYKAEQQTSLLFTVASSLAIILACLGLFGLAAFTTVQRTKEIGIRKTLGAKLSHIVILVSKNFVILVAISIVLASPFAWWASTLWLQEFSFKINIGISVFAVSAFVTLTITIVTVGYHSLRAAMANPTKSLRTE